MLCVRRAENTLNLGGLRLSSIPPVVSEMHGLLSLHLPHNRLTEFPATLTQNDGLHLLDLTGNRITQLPQDPRALGSHYTLVLTGNPLDEPSREQCLNPALRLDGPNIILQHPGPHSYAAVVGNHSPADPRQAPDRHPRRQAATFIHEHPAHMPPMRARLGWHDEAVEHPSHDAAQFQQIVERWRQEAGGFGEFFPHLTDDDWAQLTRIEHAGSFAFWLQRLTETADYATPSARSRTHSRVLRLFDALVADGDFAAICFAIADESIATCGDRVAIGLNQMEMAAINREVDRGTLDTDALFKMGAAQFRLTELQTIASEHARRVRREHEQVEVELAYQVGLRSRLDLPLGNRHMLYRACAHVHDKDLEAAAEKIEAAQDQPAAPALALLADLADAERGTEALLRADAPHPMAQFLAADYSPWASHTATSSPVEQALTEQMHACLESLTDRVGQGLINEADYFAAANRAMFYTNHGHAYRAALTHIDRAQGARSAA